MSHRSPALRDDYYHGDVPRREPHRDEPGEVVVPAEEPRAPRAAELPEPHAAPAVHEAPEAETAPTPAAEPRSRSARVDGPPKANGSGKGRKPSARAGG